MTMRQFDGVTMRADSARLLFAALDIGDPTG